MGVCGDRERQTCRLKLKSTRWIPDVGKDGARQDLRGHRSEHVPAGGWAASPFLLLFGWVWGARGRWRLVRVTSGVWAGGIGGH